MASCSPAHCGVDMNLHQFRFVREAVRQGLNLTAAAKVLHTSQPGVSKSILELEAELGLQIFDRRGKRLRSVTDKGSRVVAAAERIFNELESLRRLAVEQVVRPATDLSIAAGHVAIRHVLPKPIAQFRRQFAHTCLTIVEGSDQKIVELVRDGHVHFGICGAAVQDKDNIIALPWRTERLVALVSVGHPLASVPLLTLEHLAHFPLIVSDDSFKDGSTCHAAFVRQELHANVALSVRDPAAIATYVELGVGVGIVSDQAATALDDPALCVRPLDHLFGMTETHLILERSRVPTDAMYALAELLAPTLSRSQIEWEIGKRQKRANVPDTSPWPAGGRHASDI